MIGTSSNYTSKFCWVVVFLQIIMKTFILFLWNSNSFAAFYSHWSNLFFCDGFAYASLLRRQSWQCTWHFSFPDSPSSSLVSRPASLPHLPNPKFHNESLVTQILFSVIYIISRYIFSNVICVHWDKIWFAVLSGCLCTCVCICVWERRKISALITLFFPKMRYVFFTLKIPVTFSCWQCPPRSGTGT